MAESELDRRKRCPKCGEPGLHKATEPTQDYTKKAVIMTCKNTRCEWVDTGWVITVMLDGSLPAEDAPEVLRAKPRAFPVLERGVDGDAREREIKDYYATVDQSIKRS